MRYLLIVLTFLVASLPAQSQTQTERDKWLHLNREGATAFKVGDYTRAVKAFEAAYALTTNAWPKDAPEALQTMNNLAILYQAQGRYAEAESRFRRVLNIREQVLGFEHPDTLISMNNLASFYKDLGRYVESERLSHRVQKISEHVLKPEHRIRLANANNLAILYMTKGQYEAAEPLLHRTLKIRERVLGLEHPNTLISVDNLASVYETTGRYAEAGPLYRRTLDIRKRVLGPEHPSTLVSVNNLAQLYRASHRYTEAERLFRRALEVRNRVMGPEHRDTLISMNNLAALLNATDRYAEAEPLLRHALKVSERIPGPEHSNTLAIINNLGMLYLATGRNLEAEQFYRRALEGNMRVLGPEHPYTLLSLHNLAFLYNATGQHAKAEQFYSRALESSKSVLGTEHLQTLATVNNLARLRLASGEHASVNAAASDLDWALSAWLQRVGRELQSGAGFGQRARIAGDSTVRDVAVSAALSFPKHAELGARALLMTKGIAGETDAALSRLVAVDSRDEVRTAANKLRLNEGLLHYSYKNGVPDHIRNARENRDDARRLLFKLIDPPKVFEPASTTSKAIAAALNKGQVFLDYGVFRPVDFASGESSTAHILLVAYRAGHGAVLHDLGPISSIRTAVLNTTDVNKRTTSVHSDHVQLRRVLLDPVIDMLTGAKEVIISPDGILARVSFGLLEDPINPDHHLIERVPVRILPSGRTLLEPPQVSPFPTTMFMGAALTDFGPHDPTKCSTNRVGNPAGGLCPLPNTVSEVTTVRNIFKSKTKSRTLELLEENATEAAVITAMPKTRFVHLATHGGVRLADLPGEGLNNVGLAFHGVNRYDDGPVVTPANDGILTGSEAARLPLWGTDLVVMSACDTALGDDAGAEGIWSMAHAFRLSGVNTVIMTLWKVSDNTAPEFMEYFYQTLLKRQEVTPNESIRNSIRIALRETQIWAIGQSWSYWDYAPFVLVENQN